jgi:hypothetical protein
MTFCARGASRRSICAGVIFFVGAATAGGRGARVASLAGELLR